MPCPYPKGLCGLAHRERAWVNVVHRRVRQDVIDRPPLRGAWVDWAERLAERLKPGNTADIMRRIEERLEVFRKSDFAGCGDLLKKAMKYAMGEQSAMKRVLECGDVELSNNLSEQMMRRIKMNLKNAGNIGSERSAKQNTFMYSVIES